MLGISVYPYKEDIEKTLEYIDLAGKLGYRRMFLNLLLFDESKIAEFVESNRKVISKAKEHDIEVFIDVNPNIFKLLGVSYDNLSFFHDLGVDGIRLDHVFDGDVESDLTYNEYGLKIELNASQNTKYIENIIMRKPNVRNLTSCHNFYPQKYSGLSEEFYVKTSKISKECNLRTAAFVTSQNNAHGPHPVDDNLPTLEKHRYLPIDVQLKHLIALGNIDDVIISNAYASNEELEKLVKVYKPYVVFEIEKIREYQDVELSILSDLHKNRGDVGEYQIRSSFGRVKYKKESIIPVKNNSKITRGTVYICNNNYGQYKGELDIARKDMDIDLNKVNIVGHIKKEEEFLLDYIEEYSRFEIMIK